MPKLFAITHKDSILTILYWYNNRLINCDNRLIEMQQWHFRVFIAWTIMLNLIMKWILCPHLPQFHSYTELSFKRFYPRAVKGTYNFFFETHKKAQNRTSLSSEVKIKIWFCHERMRQTANFSVQQEKLKVTIWLHHIFQLHWPSW